MSSATAPRYAPILDEPFPRRDETPGVQGLLRSSPPRPNYAARCGAVLLYALAFGAVVELGFSVQEKPIEEQSVIELAPIPADETVEEEPPPPEEPDLPEPPPPEPEAVAPLPEVKPPPPKPVQKPKPKVEKDRPRREPKPAAERARAVGQRTEAPAARAPAPAGAQTSAIANHFHACMQRAASNAYPESQAPRRARVGYRAVFGPTGSLVSYSITSSGNAAFDAIANRLGRRCGSVPAPGKSVSLSGALTFSP
jgi:outer membrane biosynthesis protein TonB